MQPSRKPKHGLPMATDDEDSVQLDGKLAKSKQMVSKKKVEQLVRRRKHPNNGAGQVLAAAQDSGETLEKKKIKKVEIIMTVAQQRLVNLKAKQVAEAAKLEME